MKKAFFIALLLSAFAPFLNANGQIINTIAGIPTHSTGSSGTYVLGDGGTATSGTLSNPWSIAINASGDIFIADPGNLRIRKIDHSTNLISTYAGTGSGGSTGDFGPANAATFRFPIGLAFDTNGDLLIVDRDDHRIRKVITSSGTIVPYAGSGTRGYDGDTYDKLNVNVKFNYPWAIAVDPSNNDIYIADNGNNCIRKINSSTNFITTLSAGTLSGPRGVAVDAGSNVYISDYGNQRIQEVTSGGTISTFVGSGLNRPLGISFTGGALYIADGNNRQIKKVVGGTVTTIAGNGSSGFSGDGRLATNAMLATPTGLAVDASGNLYITELNNHIVRKVTPNLGIVGAVPVCVGATLALTDVATPSSSPWSGGSSSVATIDASGHVYGVAAGTTDITFSAAAYACYAIQTITVVGPLSLPITGPNEVCTVGSSIALACSTATTGTWSSANTSIATVGATGRVYGVTAGSVNISYTATNACGTNSGIKNITVQSTTPSPGTITGASTVCTGATTTFTSTGVSGGVWSSFATTISTVDPSTGVITGVSTGSTTIAYVVTNSCGFHSTSKGITVTTVPPAPAGIAGSSSVCTGANITLSDATSGGAWRSSNPAIATVSTTGVVTGISTGSATISYITSNSCGSTLSPATTTITVNTIPSAPAVIGGGSSPLCTGTTRTLTDDSTGGTWSSSTTAVATVDATTGIVTGVTSGSTTITYTTTNTCGSTLSPATVSVTIITTPAAPSAIGGTATPICTGVTTTLTDATTGGTWSSSSPSIASVDAATGDVTSVIVGTATITYTVSNICGNNYAVAGITTIATPSAGTITEAYGRSTICAPHGIYSTLNLSDAVTGGTWSSSNTMVAAVSTGGIVSGTAYLTPGTAIISYSVTNTCGTSYATYNVTAESNPDPGAISPDAGYSSTITSTTPAIIDVHLASSSLGTWGYTVTSGTATITLTPTTGTGQQVSKVSGTGSTGVFDITYTLSNSCATTSAHFTITVAAGRGIANATGGIEESSSPLKTYPNPTTGVVTLELPKQNDNTELMIFDVSGKVVETKTTNEAKISFDMSGYSKGVYMIQVKSGDHTYNEKVVFQ